MILWSVIIGTCVGCYLLKLAGLSAPRRLLDHPAVRRFAMAVPVALLAALIAVQTATDGGQELTLDPARLGGMGAAAVALLLRAPFLVVLLAAAGAAAGLRLLGL
ncbi:AzlD domain-containing protein [Streptomonospora sp. S1-112]|uniref:AzlD domain-containing protein n=1 Tax=Streptomonospora mangrovi TaxID=2883123 RepID=A0A9X3SR72_9ACTN|nr:AzlD domain-containing protein [Streptomonospora mangrovi]MDA0567056.1 AzlD domain-containing protein [Streptomonospora mangrovi]